MFDALRIDPGSLHADADREKERFHDLVPLSTDACKVSACVRQKDTPIRALLDVSLRNQPLQHLGDCRLCDAKALSDIDLPRLAAVIEKIGNEFNVILYQFATAVVPRLPKTLHLGVWRDKRTFYFSWLAILLTQLNSRNSTFNIEL